MDAALTRPIRVEKLDGGALHHVLLDAPKGNILDQRMIEALTAIFRGAQGSPGLKAILLEGSGGHFSYGASVEEHLPDTVSGMLRAFHGLFRAMLESAVPTIAVVSGRCLGGGLELASFCHRVFAAPNAKLGQPEIVLGVFAPVASVFLPERIGRGAAEDLCLSGRAIGAAEAHRIGLVDEVAEDPHAAALVYARAHLLPRSAASLRFATRAARIGLKRRLEELDAVEAMYLDELMATRDANEGLRAFLEKRAPVWRNQ